MDIVVGAVLLLLGAAGATAASQRLEDGGRAPWVPVALVPMGVLIGAGAALIRGSALWSSIAVGAAVVPLAWLAFRAIEGAWRGRRRRTANDDLS